MRGKPPKTKTTQRESSSHQKTLQGPSLKQINYIDLEEEPSKIKIQDNREQEIGQNTLSATELESCKNTILWLISHTDSGALKSIKRTVFKKLVNEKTLHMLIDTADPVILVNLKKLILKKISENPQSKKRKREHEPAQIAPTVDAQPKEGNITSRETTASSFVRQDDDNL